MKLRIVDYTDSINECDCCGKKDLKGTFVMADEYNNEVYYGRVCAAKAANWSMSEFSENLASFKAKKSRLEKIKALIDPLKEEIAKFGFYDTYLGKPINRQRQFRNECTIIKNEVKLKIDLLNDVFLPLGFPVDESFSNEKYKMYFLNGKGYTYDR